MGAPLLQLELATPAELEPYNKLAPQWCAATLGAHIKMITIATEAQTHRTHASENRVDRDGQPIAEPSAHLETMIDGKVRDIRL